LIVAPRLNRLPAAERGITIGDFLVPVSLGERISTRARHLALIVAGALFIALTAQFVIVREPVGVSDRLKPSTPLRTACGPLKVWRKRACALPDPEVVVPHAAMANTAIRTRARAPTRRGPRLAPELQLRIRRGTSTGANVPSAWCAGVWLSCSRCSPGLVPPPLRRCCSGPATAP